MRAYWYRNWWADQKRTAQVDLLAACCARHIPRLCIGGAAAKADPTRLRFVDIKEAMIDHLAVKIRWRLRREHGITAGVPVLLSTEKRRVDHVFTAELAAADNMLDYQVRNSADFCLLFCNLLMHPAI